VELKIGGFFYSDKIVMGFLTYKLEHGSFSDHSSANLFSEIPSVPVFVGFMLDNPW